MKDPRKKIDHLSDLERSDIELCPNFGTLTNELTKAHLEPSNR